jgi:hypothetical protein
MNSPTGESVASARETEIKLELNLGQASDLAMLREHQHLSTLALSSFSNRGAVKLLRIAKSQACKQNAASRRQQTGSFF